MTLYALKQRYFKERERESEKIHIFLRLQTEQWLHYEDQLLNN